MSLGRARPRAVGFAAFQPCGTDQHILPIRQRIPVQKYYEIDFPNRERLSGEDGAKTANIVAVNSMRDMLELVSDNIS